mmetsp:Transcript_110999/g.314135  ORF Transcript_110999/g.314135 Transcript_110999/m.314135 type:complete len:298 (+) Transcript_110999:198-1091(+)
MSGGWGLGSGCKRRPVLLALPRLLALPLSRTLQLGGVSSFEVEGGVVRFEPDTEPDTDLSTSSSETSDTLAASRLRLPSALPPGLKLPEEMFDFRRSGTKPPGRVLARLDLLSPKVDATPPAESFVWPLRLLKLVISLLTARVTGARGISVPWRLYCLSIDMTRMTWSSTMVSMSSSSSVSLPGSPSPSPDALASSSMSVTGEVDFSDPRRHHPSPRVLMSFARPAEPTEITAPIFACPRSPGSVNAVLATNSATVSPTPPSAAMVKRSVMVMPAGRSKPRYTANMPKPAMPSVFPT